jgi:hypothetical protein
MRQGPTAKTLSLVLQPGGTAKACRKKRCPILPATILSNSHSLDKRLPVQTGHSAAAFDKHTQCAAPVGFWIQQMGECGSKTAPVAHALVSEPLFYLPFLGYLIVPSQLLSSCSTLSALNRNPDQPLSGHGMGKAPVALLPPAAPQWTGVCRLSWVQLCIYCDTEKGLCTESWFVEQL